ncbi:MAG: hypothetical protein Q9174_001307 [Haloplaca sp. 1 TL-2023]
MDADADRDSHPEEVVEVFKIWEADEIVTGSAEWKRARIRMLRDIIFRGEFQAYKRRGLVTSPEELAATRCWFLERADGSVAKYPSIVLPWCFKDLIWDLTSRTHITVRRNASTFIDPDVVPLLDISLADTLVGLQSMRISRGKHENMKDGLDTTGPKSDEEDDVNMDDDSDEYTRPDSPASETSGGEEMGENEILQDPRADAIFSTLGGEYYEDLANHEQLERHSLANPANIPQDSRDMVHDWFLQNSKPYEPMPNPDIPPSMPREDTEPKQPMFKPGGGVNRVGESTAGSSVGSDETEKPRFTSQIPSQDAEAELPPSRLWDESTRASVSTKRRAAPDQKENAEEEERPKRRRRGLPMWEDETVTSDRTWTINKRAEDSRAARVLALHNPSAVGQELFPVRDDRTRLLLRARSALVPKRNDGPKPMEE